MDDQILILINKDLNMIYLGRMEKEDLILV